MAMFPPIGGGFFTPTQQDTLDLDRVMRLRQIAMQTYTGIGAQQIGEPATPQPTIKKTEVRGRSWMKKHWPKWRYLRYRLAGYVSTKGGQTGWAYRVTKDNVSVCIPLPGKAILKMDLCITVEGAAIIDRFCTLSEYVQFQEHEIWKVANIKGQKIIKAKM